MVEYCYHSFMEYFTLTIHQQKKAPVFYPSLFSLRSRFRIDQFRALWWVGRGSIQRLAENLGALLSTFHLPAAKIVASGVFLPDGKYVLGYFGQKICLL